MRTEHIVGQEACQLALTQFSGLYRGPAQVRAFGGAGLPGLVLEADPRPGRRR